MKTLTLHGLAWHVISPSRFRLIGWQHPCELAYTPADGWNLLGANTPPIPCRDRDTGARWIAEALRGTLTQESLR